jgi:hypothetical protein
MKKLLLTFAIIAGNFGAFAQHINLGIFGSAPVGDAQDVSTIGAGVEGTVLLPISSKFEVGVNTGFTFFKGKTHKFMNADNKTEKFTYQNAKYIPILGAIRYNISDELYLGTDVGYTLGIGKDIRGGLQIKPRLGVRFNEKLASNISYTLLKDNKNTWKSINLGFEYTL